MHERTELEFALRDRVEEIRDGIEGEPPVIVVVGGTEGGPGATSTASVGLDRLRDLNGVLETAKYVENGKHYEPPPDDLPVEDGVETDFE